MSNLIRDTFIHLHSQDLVGELRQEVRFVHDDDADPASSWTVMEITSFLSSLPRILLKLLPSA